MSSSCRREHRVFQVSGPPCRALRTAVGGCVAVLVSMSVAGCGQDVVLPHGVSGHRWTLVRTIEPSGKMTDVSSAGAYLMFDGNQLTGSDACGSIQGTVVRAQDAHFTLGDVAVSANGCLSEPGVKAVARAGIDTLIGDGAVGVTNLSAGLLVLRVGGWVLSLAHKP